MVVVVIAVVVGDVGVLILTRMFKSVVTGQAPVSLGMCGMEEYPREKIKQT